MKTPFRISPELVADSTIDSHSPSVIATGKDFIVTYSSDTYFSSVTKPDGLYGQKVSASGVLQGQEFQVSSYSDSSYADHYYGLSQENKYQAAPLSESTWMGVWSGVQSGAYPAIYGQLLHNNGTKIGEPFQISADDQQSYYMPRAIGLPEGGCAVLYKHSAEYVLRGQFYDKNGMAYGAGFSVPYNNIAIDADPSLAAVPTEILLTTEQYNDSEGMQLQNQHISSAEQTLGQQIGTSLVTSSSGYILDADTIAFPGGVSNTVWYQINERDNQLQSRIYGKRSDTDNIMQLNRVEADEITATAYGDSMLLGWKDYNDKLYIQRFTQHNQPDSQVFTIGTSDDCPGTARFSPVLSANNGVGLLTWNERVDGRTHICGQIVPELDSLSTGGDSWHNPLSTPVTIGVAIAAFAAGMGGLFALNRWYNRTSNTRDSQENLVPESPSTTVTGGATDNGTVVTPRGVELV